MIERLTNKYYGAQNKDYSYYRYYLPYHFLSFLKTNAKLTGAH